MVSFNKEYYEKLMKSYEYSPFEVGFFDFSFGIVGKEKLQTMFLCHHNGRAFSRALSRGDSAIVTTGFGISGIPHVGTLSQIRRCLHLQENSIPVQIVLGDLDAYNGKNKDFGYVKELTSRYESYIKNLGFKCSSGSILRDQYGETGVLRDSYMLGKYMLDDMFDSAEEDLHSLYSKEGKVDSDMTYRRKLSLNLMTADFISLGQRYDNVLVMLGVDEHKYVRFAKKTLANLGQDKDSTFKEFNFGAVYTGLIKGFNGFPKMSKSFPDSGITVLSTEKEILNKICNGDSDYIDPQDSVVFQMICAIDNKPLTVIKDIYIQCSEKSKKWDKYKIEFAELLIDLLKRW